MNRKELKKIFLNLSYLAVNSIFDFVKSYDKIINFDLVIFFKDFFFENGLDLSKINEQDQLELKKFENALVAKDFR
jgi:hypothetical protein